MNERDRDDDFSQYTVEIDFDTDEEILSDEEIKLLRSTIEERIKMIDDCEHEFEEQYNAEFGEVLVCPKCDLMELLGKNH